MSNKSVTTRLPGGTVHELPSDFETSLTGDEVALAAWHDITALARNEWICWVTSAKQDVTRKKRMAEANSKLNDGLRRPCCWPGCSHRERNGH